MKSNLLLLSVKVQNFLSREDGQDLVEYGLCVALIGLLAMAGMRSLSTAINDAFTGIGVTLTNNI